MAGLILGATYFMSLNVLMVYFCPCFTAEEIEVFEGWCGSCLPAPEGTLALLCTSA